MKLIIINCLGGVLLGFLILRYIKIHYSLTVILGLTL